MTGCNSLALVPLLCLSAVSLAAADEKGKTANAPATVENRVKETDLTTVKLTPDAERRLGIELAAAERRMIAQTRTLPGEITIPPGGAIVVSAPIAGLVTLPPSSTSPPAAWQRVQQGQALLRLLPGEARDGQPFVPADRISLARAKADLTSARIEAEGQLEQARVRAEAAQVKLQRAEVLLNQGAGARRDYDEARAELDLAQTQRSASQERIGMLSAALASLESGDQAAVAIEAPLEGYIRTVHSAPGQVASSGAPLLEIVALDPIWVRVPVYVGDLAAVQTGAEARVRGLADGAESPARQAKRVPAPGAADPRAATVDLYFELANPAADLRPGQRVAVELPTTATAERLVVPNAAVLFDIYGGAWVYENVAPQTYTRRRVAIREVVGDLAVLGRGLEPGAKVVTDGAAELFGTEFGVGK